MSTRARDILAFVAGSTVPLGYAPIGWFPVPIFALAALYRLLDGASPGTAFRRGWLFALGMFGVGVSWIQVSVHQFGLPVLAFSVGATALFIAFISLYGGVFGWVAARSATTSPPRRLLLVLPGAWVALEWARGVLLTGFPWLALGYSQIDSPLAGYAPIGGVYAVGLAVTVSAGAFALLAGARGRLRLLLLLLFASIWGAGLQLTQVDFTAASGGALRAVLVQGNVEQKIKWEPAERDRTIALYRGLTEPHWGADVIVWPETAIPAFQSQVMDELESLQARAETSGSTLLLGIPALESAQRYYNGVIGLGAEPGLYYKRHLVPFGEYMPLAPILGPILHFLDVPMSDFSAGDRTQATLPAAGRSAAVSICYEDAYGELVRQGLPAAALLVNVSNDAWFGDSLAPHQHLEIARMRALETGRWMLRATNTGISAIIDHRGRIAVRSAQFEEATVAGMFEARVGATPYVRAGVAPALAVALALVALGINWRRRDNAGSDGAPPRRVR